jgi:hypothetical protein
MTFSKIHLIKTAVLPRFFLMALLFHVLTRYHTVNLGLSNSVFCHSCTVICRTQVLLKLCIYCLQKTIVAFAK